MKIPFVKHLSWYLIVAIFIISIAPRVEAGFVPSEIMNASHVDRNAAIEKIRKILEVKAVSERMKQLGLTQNEIQARFAKLSDQQIHQIALELDNIEIGQSDAFGFAAALLLVAIIIVVVLKITGHKVIITR